MDKLTVDILANYLPFNTTLLVESIYSDFTCPLVVNNSTNSFRNGMDIDTAIEYNAKPFLLPLSYLTKEITHEGERFIPIECLNEEAHTDDGNVFTFNGKYLMFHNNKDTQWNYLAVPMWAFQSLHRWHFDLYDLIPKNLAIDKRTINTNLP